MDIEKLIKCLITDAETFTEADINQVMSDLSNLKKAIELSFYTVNDISVGNNGQWSLKKGLPNLDYSLNLEDDDEDKSDATRHLKLVDPKAHTTLSEWNRRRWDPSDKEEIKYVFTPSISDLTHPQIRENINLMLADARTRASVASTSNHNDAKEYWKNSAKESLNQAKQMIEHAKKNSLSIDHLPSRGFRNDDGTINTKNIEIHPDIAKQYPSKIKKSNYPGYTPEDNAKRKENNVDEVPKDVGPNYRQKKYTTSGSSASEHIRNKQAKEQKKKSKQSLKVYTPEQIAALNAALKEKNKKD